MRSFTSLGVLLGLMFGLAMAADAPGKGDKLRVYIGTYTRPNASQGIYLSEFDLATGKLSEPRLAAEAVNPSFLALSRDNRFLYSVSEVGSFKGKKGGAVSAFSVEPSTGQLKLLNQQSAGGEAPCHLVVDNAGKNVLVANYTGGNISCLPLQADGQLGEATGFVQHKGSGADPRRQKEPHAHSINLDPANRFAFVADLGLDKVLVYRFDPAKGTLNANDPPFAAVAPAAGPRHFAFHPNGKFAYAINELNSTVTPFAYDAEKGILKPLKPVSTLPQGFSGANYPAEVVVHPSGRYVYGSNRGHDSIAIFSVNPDSGELTPVGHLAEGIKTPRNFNIDPTGAYLIVANQNSNSLQVHRIDPATGKLERVGEPVKVFAPVCVKFAPLPKS